MKHRVFLLLAAGLVVTAFGQWEPDVRVTDDTANTFLCGQQCLVALGDTLHAVFVDDRSGNYNVYYTRSLDAGATWGSAVRLSPGDSNRIFGATIAAAGAAVHVVWEGRNNGAFWYRRSTDGGETWRAETALVQSPRSCGTPVLSADGDRVGLVWTDSRDGGWNGELYYKQSLSAGRSWADDTRLTADTDSVLDKEACLVVSGNYRYIVWTRADWNTSVAQVWFTRSTDNGATWQPRVRVATDTTRQEQPMVAASGSSVHLCWYDGRPDEYGIYHRASLDNGATWGAEHWLTDITYGADYPAIAAVGANVHVAFRATRPGQLVLDYRGSTDNGATWSPDTTLSSLAGMGSANLAATGSRAHILFYDDRDGNFELYHKRNLNAGGVEEYATRDALRRPTDATIIRSALRLPVSGAGREAPGVLLDACGRQVLTLRAGANDVSLLAPGVYFLAVSGEVSRVAGFRGQRVVIAR